MECLAELDARGFLVGAGEDCATYAERLKALKARFEGMESALDEKGIFELEGLKFPADRRIPQELITNVATVTERRYSFGVDWVPGFFADRSFGWLFGGCAYYFHPEFFAVFILRRSFAKRSRWLIYNRDELLAHELCHVARAGLHSGFFEEEFAYGVSTSRFRRLVGGLFRTGNEAFLILGAALLLLAVQMIRLFAFPGLPIWPFWLAMAGVVAYLAARLVQLRKLIRAARRAMAPIAGDATEAVLFRCADDEIMHISQAGDEQELRNWILDRAAKTLRWKVIDRRFLTPTDQGPTIRDEDRDKDVDAALHDAP